MSGGQYILLYEFVPVCVRMANFLFSAYHGINDVTWDVQTYAYGYCFQPIRLAPYDDVIRPQICDTIILTAKFWIISVFAGDGHFVRSSLI